MSLRFIYGRAGTGKSFFCFNDIKSRLEQGDDRRLILLVPEQFSLQAERNLIKTVGAEGILQAEVLSFRRMAYRVFNEVGGLTRPHINPAGKCMLLHRIMDDMKDELKIFSGAIRQQGFARTVSDMITEFKRYNVTPELLRSAANNLKDDDILKTKLEEISKIFSEFETRLHVRYTDSDDDLTELAKKLDKSLQFDGAEIWIDEFSGFTPQEFGVIEKLLKKVRRINVSLCADCLDDCENPDSTNVFSPVLNTVARLKKIAAGIGVDIEAPIRVPVDVSQPGRFGESRELKHLERYFFSFPYCKYNENTKDIKVFAAANIYSEVENTARDIISLCRDKGMRYKDIAVVSRNLDEYESLVRAIFSDYGIPYFIDKKRDIIKHPLVMLILSVFEIFSSNWSYAAVFRYLKTGLTNVDRKSVDILENYALAHGIRGSVWTNNERWDFSDKLDNNEEDLTDYEKEVLVKVKEARDLFVEPLVNFRMQTKGKRKAREMCSALFEFLCSTGVSEKIDKMVESFKESGELALANEYSQVWNIVMEVLDQTVEVLGDEPITLDKLGNVLSIGFAEYNTGLIPPALDQVLVGSVERSKSHNLSALYILGVNDGVFPAPAAEEGVLSDMDRERLLQCGVELAQDTRTRAFEEQYLIYTTLTTPEKYLRLSYSIADREGRTMRPSVIISRLKKIFPKLHESSNIVSENSTEAVISLIASPGPTMNELVSAVRQNAEGKETSPVWKDVCRWYISKDEWKDRCIKAVSGIAYSNNTDFINHKKAVQLYGNNIFTSVSRLESFASCPFSFFVRYGLKAKERKIFKLTPPDIGTFMHTVIDRFSKRIEDTNNSWRSLEREKCREMVSDIVDEMLAEMPGSVLNSSKRYKTLTIRLKRILERAVWLIAEHIKRGDFEPQDYEVVFGIGGKFPPITIELPSGEKLNLTGRIDRIDTMKTEEGTYLRIIDYKSGNKAFKLSDAYYGLEIQLLAYLDAALDSSSNNTLLPGGVFYFKLDDPLIRCDGNPDKETVEKAIMKELKMKGLLLADVKLVKAMDRQIDGDSLIIPARINKGDVLGRSSAATLEQFDMLRRHVRRLLVKIGTEIVRGNVSVRPYRRKNITACKYCSYLPVCQFDPSSGLNSYRFLRDIDDDNVWDILNDNDTKTTDWE